IANVSHDLRTPLTSILGYLQLLEGDTLTPEERAEYLAVIESRAKALQSLITGFYDLSRLEGEGYPMVREQVALSPLLTD
ncbi:MAG: histidine kinase dimerization/phospho-acceptor domain-containing protein, partial [Oscillospiraceae bacterium]